MNRSCRVALVALLTLSAALALAQAPAGKEPPPPRADDVKLPADSILVLYEKMADALRATPTMRYLLTPERYNYLLGEIERLNKQVQARQPLPISSWKVSGKVRGGLAELKVIFEFVTHQERSAVTLACSRGLADRVLLDKEVPPLWQASEGIVIEVEKPGRHQAEVDLVIKVRDMAGASGAPAPARPSPADAVLGFELDLPFTPVTSVDLELPDGVKAVEVNDQAPGDFLQGNRLKATLGKPKGLKLTWKSPHAMTGPVPLLTARGKITVRVLGSQVDTDAELTLQDQGRPARDWQLQLPERARVRLVNAADRQRLRSDLPSHELPDGRLTVPLANPGGDPLTLFVSVRRERSGSAPIPVGPFAVEGAVSQTGVVEVVTDADQRITCQPYHPIRSAFSITEQAIEPGKGPRPEARDGPQAGVAAAFRYSSLASSERVALTDPWFRLDVGGVEGQLDTQVSHILQPENGAGRSGWRLTTTLDAQPVRTEVKQLEWDWPAPWRLDREHGFKPRGRVKPEFREDLGSLLRLGVEPESLKPFKLTFQATAGESDPRSVFPVAPNSPHSTAIVRLPRPRNVLDRGGHRIIVEDPGKTHDFRVRQPANPDLELVSTGTDPHRLEYRVERLAQIHQVAVAWQPYRPEVRVDSVVDVKVTGDQVDVKHRLYFRSEEKGRLLPAHVSVQVPVAIPRTRLGLLKGGKETGAVPEVPGAAERQMRYSLDTNGADGAEVLLILRYGTTAAQAGKKVADETVQRLIPVPLVWVEDATLGEMRVRVWAEPGSVVRAVPGGWGEPGLEVVEDQDRLPSLVLTSPRPSQQLSLRIETPTEGEQRPVLVERALIQVRIDENNFQQHRARFLIRQLTVDHIDLAFHAPVASLDLQATLDGKKLARDPAVESGPSAGEAEGRRLHIARLKLPQGPLKRPAVLEVTYQLPPARGFFSALQSVLQPVTLPGLTAGVPIRWQVDLPSNWVPLSPDDSVESSWRWGRRGWLLAPRPAVNSGDLERWFWGEGDPRGTALSEEDAALLPGFVGWRGSLGPLTLYHAPQQAWLLLCSLVVLVLGLALGHAALGSRESDRKRGRLFWTLIALLVLGLGVVGLIWPGLVGAFLYGAQPGLAVVWVVLTVQWLLHERYKRRVIFLPGFRRVKSGSSLARASRPEKGPSSAGRGEGVPALAGAQPGRSSSGQRRSEPSTVDAPPGEAKPH